MNLLNRQCELIVIDDCSVHFKAANKNACKKHTYIELNKNIGRAKIRNLFLKYAKYDYLLFLDCDLQINTSSFLSKYLEASKKKPKVVCGGLLYEKICPERERRLRWKYGMVRESQSCAVRRKFPNKSFMTSNFLISKKLLQENGFDERIVKYGHEDTLFGYALKKKNITINHIENPVVHKDIDINEEFLNKTKMSIISLIEILQYEEYKDELNNNFRLLKFYAKVKKIEKIIHITFLIFEPLIVFLLTKGYICLYLFDYYKLGIFIRNFNKAKQ